MQQRYHGSHTVTENDATPRATATLRLRISQSHPRALRPGVVIAELKQKLQSEHESTRYIGLLNVASRLPALGCTTAYCEAADLLLRLLSNEVSENVISKCIDVLSNLARHPLVGANAVANAIIDVARASRSPRIRESCLNGLLRICLAKSNPELHALVLGVAKRFLNLPHQAINCAALHIVARLTPLEDSGQCTTEDAQTIVGLFLDDNDPRVRAAALNCLFILHQRGLQLRRTLYPAVVENLRDEFEIVRLEAVTLVWLLATVYADKPVTVEGTELSLVDSGFATICNMVNDSMLAVRVRACQLLGSMRGVRPAFLLQTLDKKLMSQLKVRQSGYDLRAEKLRGDAGIKTEGESEFNPDELSLIDSGACGAFVQALEDQYLEVRMAALDAMGELAAHCSEFALRALDFLVDMLNDEIDEVRMNAMLCLRKICTHVELYEDHLDTILTAMLGKAWEIRAAVHSLLANMRLANTECLRVATRALLGNLLRFPGDFRTVCLALKHLGAEHSAFVQFYVEELMQIDRQFATTEPNVDDAAYIAVLVLVCNAAQKNSIIMTLCPSFVRSHYAYLRDKWPELFPESIVLPPAIFFPEAGPTSGVIVEGPDMVSITNDYIARTLGLLEQGMEQLRLRKHQAAVTAWRSAAKDLEHARIMTPSIAAKADYCLSYIRALECLLKSQRACQRPGAIRGDMELERSAHQLLHATLRLEHLYSGTDRRRDTPILLNLRLVAHVTLVLAALGRMDGAAERTASLLAGLESHVTEICSVLPGLPASDMVNRALEAVRGARAQAGTAQHRLLPLVMGYTCQPLNVLHVTVRRTHARLRHGIGSEQAPFVFPSSLPVTLPVRATLSGVENINEIRIQVEFPGGQLQLITPDSSHFVASGNGHYTLRTDVSLILPPCAGPCAVKLRLVLQYQRGSHWETLMGAPAQGLPASELYDQETMQARIYGDSIVSGYVSISEQAHHFVHALPPPVMRKDTLFV